MRKNIRIIKFIKNFDILLLRLGYERILIKEQKVCFIPNLGITYRSNCD